MTKYNDLLDSLIDTRASLKDAKIELEYFTKHNDRSLCFNETVVSIPYDLRNDGGDASRKGVLQITLSRKEIRDFIEKRIESISDEVKFLEEKMRQTTTLLLNEAIKNSNSMEPSAGNVSHEVS